MDEDKNFRSSYYNKIGCKCTDERAIDKFFDEKPLDVNKIIQYSQRYDLPSCHRLDVWKTIYGFTASREEEDRFINDIHNDITNLLLSALECMSLIGDETPDDQKLLLMYLLEMKDISTDLDKQLTSMDCVNICYIFTCFAEFAFPFNDTYWLAKMFCCKVEEQKQTFIKMATKFEYEDENLEEHLKETGARDVMPISIWFMRCFAGIIHKTPFIKICDRLVAGSFKILPIIARNILHTRKDELLMMTSPTDIRKKLLEPISLTISEKIVNSSLAM